MPGSRPSFTIVVINGPLVNRSSVETVFKTSLFEKPLFVETSLKPVLSKSDLSKPVLNRSSVETGFKTSLFEKPLFVEIVLKPLFIKD